jgi:tetratricopeptide (TPR) repeat protein
MKPAHVIIGFGIVTALVPGRFAVQPMAAERFEVASIKAVRPTLVGTVDALKKGNVAKAKESFEAYDTAWNGIEVYINTRDREMYNELEKNYQTKIEEGLTAPKPDVAAVLANAQAMLVKFDQAIAMIEKAAPLNPLYDDVARIRTARSPLRNIAPALKEGDVARARKALAAFRGNWPRIRDFVKMRSSEAYDAVEKGLPELDAALKSSQPDAEQVTALVNGMMGKINAVVFQLTNEARKA